MAFVQLTYGESLRDIEVCLPAQAAKLYRMGFRHEINRSTQANANETRNWRIHTAFRQPRKPELCAFVRLLRQMGGLEGLRGKNPGYSLLRCNPMGRMLPAKITVGGRDALVSCSYQA